jgi:hypothetical protein
MAQPTTCPFCLDFSIHSIMKDVQFSATVGALSYSVNEFVAFSCSSGHVFLVRSFDDDLRDSERTPVVSARTM